MRINRYNNPDGIIRLIKESIAEETRSGDLAFLLLTSKSEHYIRDRVSLNLKEILGNKYLISREWGKNKSKIDIAVLRRGNSKKPVLMLED